MGDLIKQFLFTMMTPPKHVNELLEFVEDNYRQGEISLYEYYKLLALLSPYYSEV